MKQTYVGNFRSSRFNLVQVRMWLIKKLAGNDIFCFINGKLDREKGEISPTSKGNKGSLIFQSKFDFTVPHPSNNGYGDIVE